MLHEHLFNTRTESVFRVTDKNSNTFALKAFSYMTTSEQQQKAEQLVGFGTDRATMLKITKALCPHLLSPPLSSEPLDVTCDNSHIELLAGLDVDVVGDNGEILKSKVMNITNSQGLVTERHVEFSTNLLVPYTAGGRMGDVIDNNPNFRSILNRYLAYTNVAAQLVEAVKRLHTIGVSHAGITPSTVYCSNAVCDEVTLGEFGRSFAEKDPILASMGYVNEIAQESVRFMSVYNQNKNDVDPKVVKQAFEYLRKPVTWDAARKVDWFGLGGTLFYIVGGSRIYVDSVENVRTSSRMLAEFIVSNLGDSELVDRIKDPKSRRVLEKVRSQVAEGLALIDGLLTIDRSKRISFDNDLGRSQMSTGLRANRAVLSVLQTDSRSPGNTCAHFLKETKRVVGNMDQSVGIPSFIQQVC